MVTYRATRNLTVVIPSTRRDQFDVDGEVTSSVWHNETVPAGSDLTIDQVIALEHETGQLDELLADGSIVIEKE